MKNTLLVSAALLLLLLAGFYFYSLRTNQATSGPLLDLVPADAVLIYQNNKPSFAKPNAPDLATWIRRALRQDSIFISPLNSKEALLSLHITGKEDFGIIYYLPDSSILRDITFKKLVARGTSTQRNFEGYQIRDIGNISYTTIGRVIILSHQSLLIEDVIRSQKDDATGFRKRNDQLFHLMPVDAGQGKLYADVNAVAKFCGLFFSDEVKSIPFKSPGSAVISEARIDGDVLLLNGFASDSSANETSLLSLFNEQRPAASEIPKMVSNRALLFVHYGIPDYNTWTKKRDAYKGSAASSDPARRKNVAQPEFYAALADESGYFALAGPKGETNNVILQEIKKDRAEKLIRILSGDDGPVENYSSYTIYALATSGLLETLLWPLLENKHADYFTLYNQYLIFAETPDILKGYIDDIEEDNIWGKSSEWNTFFNSSSLETNISAEINGSLMVPWLAQKLNPRWDSLSLPRELSSFNKGSIQFSRLDHSYYFNGVLKLDPSGKGQRRTKLASAVPAISLTETIGSITLVKNHATNAQELLVQTSDNVLSLIDSDLKVLFSIALKDKIASRVFQIDYYKNKKLQYLFIAGQSLHLIDRLGKTVGDFPLAIETAAVPHFLSVLDYDNTKNYRFLIADEKGNFEMTQKEGKLLEGWSTQSVQSGLFSAPRFVRSGGRDVIIVVTSQGIVTAFNRKGESIKGFPVTTGIRPQGDWFFEKRSGEDDLIMIVTSDGAKVQIDMKGKTRDKENYVRSAPDSKFSLLLSPAMDDYVVSRIDKGKIALLNRNGEVMFEKQNPGSDLMQTGYYSPASGEKIFCFRDAQQDFIYLFDEHGGPIFARPLESDRMPLIIRTQKDGLRVFTALGREVARNIP